MHSPCLSCLFLITFFDRDHSPHAKILEVAVKKQSCSKSGRSLDVPIQFQGKVSSLTRNISQSGMLCRTSREIEEMTLLEVRFQLPGVNNHVPANWVECSGVVVRCERKAEDSVELPYEVAIFFDTISEENRTLLASYVQDD